jgi:hypothetical protein
MRLWTLHPQYLDTKGLVAVWREGLLAQKVLNGQTRGYRHHPQLHRFINHPTPLIAIAVYLNNVHLEATVRGYNFDATKIGSIKFCEPIVTTQGQLLYEWTHLLEKLKIRAPAYYTKFQSLTQPKAHLLFTIVPGEIETWEVLKST